MRTAHASWNIISEHFVPEQPSDLIDPGFERHLTHCAAVQCTSSRTDNILSKMTILYSLEDK